ncbi:MAG: limonene-1,2-epoxide hydrolase family protein [Steroidobacteraceae bacterium]
MVNRRRFIGAASAGAALAAAPGAQARPRQPDYYRLFLDVILAWRRHDAEGVVARMSDAIVWYPAVGGPPVTGKARIREALQALAPHRGAERWRIFNHAVSGNRLLLEGVDDYDTDKGNRVAVPYMGIVEFEGRLISHWRDYFDAGLLARMKAGEPVPEVVLPLVSRQGEP